MASLLVVNTDVEREERKKKNRERTMKNRAKKRAAYLAALEVKGKYDPNRPVKPDPERWLPKNQRSYNKKGRKNRNNFSGAQGAGGGAQKDAAKLDAAARAAAGPSALSTKHLAVGGGGKKSRHTKR